MGSSREFRIVWVTCGSMAEAHKIARALVEKQLAACVKILGGTVESAYRWKGKVETAKERMLMIKTSARLLKKVETEIRRSHSYEVPEFLVIEVAGGSAEYLRWLRESLGK